MKVACLLDEKKKEGIGIYSISNKASLKEVAAKLVEHNVGALLISHMDDKNKYIGLISERDIIKYCAQDKDLAQIHLSDIALPNMIIITENDTLETARAIMARHHIRHLPVLSNANIVGMITIRDVIKGLDKQKNIHLRHLSDFVGGTYGNQVF